MNKLFKISVIALGSSIGLSVISIMNLIWNFGPLGVKFTITFLVLALLFTITTGVLDTLMKKEGEE